MGWGSRPVIQFCGSRRTPSPHLKVWRKNMADTKPDAIPNKATKTAVDEFMLAEYQTIAAAHFDLHSDPRSNRRGQNFANSSGHY
jgi:hypothetical protein